jgi:hypothetical protein
MSDRERLVTVWSRWPQDRWVIERTYALWYAEDHFGLSLTEERERRGRMYRIFEHGTNPNEP